jgi:predicted nucleic acid-binding protein
MQSIYIETGTAIISYLAARPADNIIDAARQLRTHQWWNDHRLGYDCFVSVVVLHEAAQGDPNAAERRKTYCDDVPVLPLRPEAVELGQQLIDERALPQKAKDDALHIALAAVYGLDYILTWNFRHIANAAMRVQIESTIQRQGYRTPVICTPDELLAEFG